MYVSTIKNSLLSSKINSIRKSFNNDEVRGSANKLKQVYKFPKLVDLKALEKFANSIFDVAFNKLDKLSEHYFASSGDQTSDEFKRKKEEVLPEDEKTLLDILAEKSHENALNKDGREYFHEQWKVQVNEVIKLENKVKELEEKIEKLEDKDKK